MKIGDIFNYEFHISLGFPRSNICDTCEKHDTQMKAARRPRKDAEFQRLKPIHELHVRKADIFNMQLVETTEEGKGCL